MTGNAGSRFRQLNDTFKRVFYVVVACLVISSSGFSVAVGQETFTYSYSNLLDGALRRQLDFSEAEMVRATEEAFALWSAVVPVTFVEVPDAGPLPTPQDSPYDADGAPDFRLGHHDITDPLELAHAFGPGFNGLNRDVHFDSSNRTWAELLFFTVAAHEIGHGLGLGHDDTEVSIMNTRISGNNILRSVDNSQLFQPEIEKVQQIYGVGEGEVITSRDWIGGGSDRWSDAANWQQGLSPSRFAEVLVAANEEVAVRSSQHSRAVSMGGGTNRLRLAAGGSLTVEKDFRMGVADGGPDFVQAGATAQIFVPTSQTSGDWTTTEFDATGWNSTTTGLGFDREGIYDQQIASDLESLLYRNTTSVYARLEFNVDDNPADLDFLQLRMQYDDGFVAYLNGVPVAHDNAPASPQWNSAALESRDDADALQAASFDLSDHLDSLLPGKNVLAVQAMNHSTTSSDMLLIPELSGGPIHNTLDVSDGELVVHGDVLLAEHAASLSTLEVREGGSVTVDGNVTRGAGVSRIVMRGGTLRVAGGNAFQMRVDRNSAGSYIIPTAETDEANDEERLWFDPDANVEGWLSGNAAFGYDREATFDREFDVDLEESMFTRSAGFYSRFEFEYEGGELPAELRLRMKYDDGFVAYLNGVEIASRNAPESRAFNSTALRSVEDPDAILFAEIPLENAHRLLRDGTNVLAIHGMNSSRASSDLLIVPELATREIAGKIHASIIDFWGGELQGIATIEGTFEQRGGNLRPQHPVDPDMTGELVIEGSYRLHEQAVLDLRIGSDTSDRLIVAGPVTLHGNLAMVTLDDEFPTLDVGDEFRATLIESWKIEGEFDEVTLDGLPILLGHQANGLFVDLEQHVDLDKNETILDFVRYLARPGDATGDRRFDSADLVAVFQIGQYEDDLVENSDWTSGDWNGDQEFSTSDLVWAFQNSLYQIDGGTALPVPEPASDVSRCWACLFLLGIRRRFVANEKHLILS